MADAYKNEYEANNHFNVGDEAKDKVKLCTQNLHLKSAKKCKEFSRNQNVDIFALQEAKYYNPGTLPFKERP